MRRAIDLLIYLSVAFGVLLLPQIYSLVPPWLFYSVLAGWIAYLLVAIATWTHHKRVYPVAFLLAILTLSVSLPEPEHYTFAKDGMWLATLTFMIGSILQLALLVLIPVYLIKDRKPASEPA